MEEEKKNNKRIIKNSIFLYLRMIILLLVNLYSSRIVLKELGITDFGIYNIVGSIVAMFTFLNTTMSGATSRFLTYELGTGNLHKVKEVFKVSLTLHICIALLIFMIAETVGLWMVLNKLVIPSERLIAATIVYQFSILTILITTIQVPFNASVIANEKMNVYAYAELIKGILLIVAISCLSFFKGDKLILYGFILFFLSIITFSIYAFYCKKNFCECSFKLSRNKKILKPMLLFSGYDLYGNMSVTASSQGLNIILNLFVGTIANAANGIAIQVQSALMILCNNIYTAFRPQIIKQYAAQNIHIMKEQLANAAVIALLLFSLLATPVFIEMPYILKLWLKTVPEYTTSITRIAICYNFINIINLAMNIPIHATGKIKYLSISGGTSYLMTIPFAYLMLSCDPRPEYAYYCIMGAIVTITICTAFILKENVPQVSIKNFLGKHITPVIFCIGIAAVSTFALKRCLDEGFIRLIIITLCNAILSCGLAFFICLNKEQRLILKNFFRNLKSKI